MTVLRLTPDFVGWLTKRGMTPADLWSPPVVWAYVALYERERQIKEEQCSLAAQDAAEEER